MRKRIIIAGKAGSGKDYLAFKLKDLNYIKDISYTTRPKREGEIEEINYHYINEELFSNMKLTNQFYETASFNGWNYGTSIDSWNNSQVFIMTPKGIEEIKDIDRKDCFIVYLDIDEDIRKERISKRSDADTVDRRIEADRLDFENFIDFDIRIINSDFTESYIIHLWEFNK